MSLSRRTFIASAAGVVVGAAAVGTVASGLATASAAKAAASGPGDVVGKITVGYQGWFACIGDNAPIDAWWHWSNNESQAPSPSNNSIKAWPDMSIYSAGYETAYANLGDGAQATLFSSYDQSTVDVHFQLMQQNGCDTAALQRFDPNGSEGPTRNAVTAKVNTAAQAYGRKFYIMYDASGWTNMQTEMPADWTANMAQYTSSSAYAHQNGKPVVGIWGFGFNDTNHPWSAAACLEVVQWFQSQGCYVMGGVPTYWRTGTSDSRAGYTSVYDAFNMISPWMVGRIGSTADSDSFYTNVNVPDQAYCNANGIDYQPCVLPGDLSANQRAHGTFMWEQLYNMTRAGAQGIYISMFDEYGEGNQILNTAATQAQVPANSGLLALNEDGTAVSSDFYLRLTSDGGRMLKGQIALTDVCPTPYQPSSSAPSGCGSLGVNVSLGVNQSLLSCDGRFNLILGGDGNLVLYEGSTPLWASNTAGQASAKAIMQGDGNFVIYTAGGSPVWASNTSGNSGASLAVQNDGNVVIYSSGGAALWSTGTAGH